MFYSEQFTSKINYFSVDPDVLLYLKILKDNGYNVYTTFPDMSFFFKLTSNIDVENDFYVYDKRENWLQLVGGTGKHIIDNIENKFSEPWAYCIHLMDLHMPFYLPPEFDSEKYGSTQYDRMISSIDYWFGEFIKKIDLKNTLVVISADHGDYIPVKEDWNNTPKVNKILKYGKRFFPVLEPIGLRLFILYQDMKRKKKLNKIKHTLTEKELIALEGRGRSEEYLFDELIRIPLIFAGYGIQSPKTVTQLVKQIDIFPTITDILKIPQQDNEVDGKSLLPLLSNNSIEETPVYLETGSRNLKNLNIPGNVMGIRTSKYKYWRSRDDPSKHVNLYDLINDPSEEKNIASENPILIKQMEKILKDMKKNSIQTKQKNLSKDEEKTIEEELKKLGYI